MSFRIQTRVWRASDHAPIGRPEKDFKATAAPAFSGAGASVGSAADPSAAPVSAESTLPRVGLEDELDWDSMLDWEVANADIVLRHYLLQDLAKLIPSREWSQEDLKHLGALAAAVASSAMPGDRKSKLLRAIQDVRSVKAEMLQREEWRRGLQYTPEEQAQVIASQSNAPHPPAGPRAV